MIRKNALRCQVRSCCGLRFRTGSLYLSSRRSGTAMKIGRPRKSRIPPNRAFIAPKLRLTDGFAVRTSDYERLCGVTSSRHFHETIVVSVGAGQLHIEIVAVWKRANGLRRNKNIFREACHGSPNWNIATSFCKQFVMTCSNPCGVWFSASSSVRYDLPHNGQE